MFFFFFVDDFVFCIRFFMYYFGIVLQEDKIEIFKCLFRLIYYCVVFFLFYLDWRELCFFYVFENSIVILEEIFSEDKKQEIQERKISKVQKMIDGEC